MKIAIIGQGALGLFLSILVMKKHPKYDVTIFDKNPNPGKKLYATGNGRCNLGNKVLDKNSYNDSLAKKLIEEYGVIDEANFLKSLGIGTRFLDNLLYPYSLNSKTFVDYLVKLAKNYKVHLCNSEEVLSYSSDSKGVSITTNKKSYIFDKAIFAPGAKSHKVFGSDGKIFELLKAHKYKITALKPGLAPIKTVENVRIIENERLKCRVNLLIDNLEVYKESGEVLFKRDGLSGICIFNVSSILARDPGYKTAVIKLDLFPDDVEDMLVKQFEKDNKVSKWNFLEGYFSPKLAEYIRKISGCKNLMIFDSTDLKKIVRTVKSMTFTYASSYSFDDSQVTVGGLEVSQLKDSFESKTEKNVYFAGEVLNLDGLCGGYNLMLCYCEAKKISENI